MKNDGKFSNLICWWSDDFKLKNKVKNYRQTIVRIFVKQLRILGIPTRRNLVNWRSQEICYRTYRVVKSDVICCALTEILVPAVLYRNPVSFCEIEGKGPLCPDKIRFGFNCFCFAASKSRVICFVVVGLVT